MTGIVDLQGFEGLCPRLSPVSVSVKNLSPSEQNKEIRGQILTGFCTEFVPPISLFPESRMFVRFSAKEKRECCIYENGCHSTGTPDQRKGTGIFIFIKRFFVFRFHFNPPFCYQYNIIRAFLRPLSVICLTVIHSGVIK